MVVPPFGAFDAAAAARVDADQAELLTGVNVFASTGLVGREASESWGSNQAALAAIEDIGAAREGLDRLAARLPIR